VTAGLLETFLVQVGHGAFFGSSFVGGISDRAQEIKRRRKRREKFKKYAKRLKKATVSEKLMLAEKIRKMTVGADMVIANMQLVKSDR
jgi:hypothetical protein